MVHLHLQAILPKQNVYFNFVKILEKYVDFLTYMDMEALRISVPNHFAALKDPI